jgi:hypothetical protein
VEERRGRETGGGEKEEEERKRKRKRKRMRREVGREKGRRV